MTVKLRHASIAAALVVLGAAACSSNSSGSSSSSGGSGDASTASSSSSGGTGTSCGLSFYPSDFPPQCQTALDETCCEEEKACAASSDCVALVECANACPPPRQDECVSACAKGSEDPPGYKELTALAGCTKTERWDAGPECNWPD